MPDISNPHDKFFKETFSRKETAVDFIRHYLPTEIVSLMDLAAVEPLKDAFVDQEMQAHYSDVLYAVPLKDGRSMFVYVLFEHKSYPDTMVAFQLLRYMVRIWEFSLRNDKRLSPILPVVVYHGQKQWRVSLHFRELFDVPEVLLEYLPDYRYFLADLSGYRDEELKGEVLLRVILLLMKHIRSNDLHQRLPEIFGLFRELLQQKSGLEYVETLLRYLASGTDKIDRKDLQKAIQKSFQEGDELMPTIAQQWIEEGRQQGLQQGIEQGKQQGLQQGIEQGKQQGLQQGIEQGKQQGLQQGIEQGKQQGMQKGLLAAIELGLELKFGTKGLCLLPEIRKIEDTDLLHAIREGIKTCNSPAELRRIYR